MKLESLFTADAHEAGSEMQVKNPATGEPMDVWLLIRGLDSKTFRAASLDYNRKMMAAKSEEREDLALDLLVSITVGWRGIDEEFSQDKIKELYQKSPAIRDQVDEFFTDRRNFIQG